MKFVLAIFILSPALAFGTELPRSSCEKILQQLDRIDAGKVQSFFPNLQIEVRSDLTLEDLDPDTRLRLFEAENFAVVNLAGGSADTPLGFRVLWLRIYDRHMQRDGLPFFSFPKFWRTPAHWYELTPQVFPQGHREMQNPASYTQVISPLSRELWEIVAQSSDVVVASAVDGTSSRFDAALKKQERRVSRNASFWLELADAESKVLLRVRVNGISARAFSNEIAEFEGSIDAPWSTWDTYGGEDGSVETVTLVSLDSATGAPEAQAWLDWIRSKFKRVQILRDE